MTYRILTEADSAGGQHIVAVTDDNVEIAGACCMRGRGCWQFYVTVLVTSKTGVPQPCHAPARSRDDAANWVETIAALYESRSAA